MDEIGSKKIVVVGGSGFVGTALLRALQEKGYQVASIDIANPKNPIKDVAYYTYSGDEFPESQIDGSFAVVNLAGAPIANRWTRQYKKVIFNSRISTTHDIVKSIRHAEHPPQILVNASAFGYYPDKNNIPVDENTAPDTDFLAEVCELWEEEALDAEKYGARVAILRTAHVVGNGGLLRSLIPLFKKRVGGYFGNGSQRMPWVSIDDLVRMYIFAIEHPLQGAYNTAADSPTQKQFMKMIARYVGSWSLPIPMFVARLVKGQMATIFKKGVYIDSSKIKNAGFTFHDTDLKETLNKLT
jgi:uncharacterized protein (TIGR01777 family)